MLCKTKLMFTRSMEFKSFSDVNGKETITKFHAGEIVDLPADAIRSSDLTIEQQFDTNFDLLEFCRNHVVLAIDCIRHVVGTDSIVVCDCSNCLNWNRVHKICNKHCAEYCTGNNSLKNWTSDGGVVDSSFHARKMVHDHGDIICTSKQLKKLSEPLVKFIREHFDEYTRISVDVDGVCISTKEIDIPFSKDVMVGGKKLCVDKHDGKDWSWLN